MQPIGQGWRRSPVAAVVAAILLSVGCSDGEERTTPTASSTSSTPSTATSTTSAAPRVELRGDGLGAVSFGASFDEVVDTLTQALGEPTTVGSVVPFETGCAGPEEECRSPGTPCSTATVRRHVEWPGLRLFFLGSDEASLVLTAWDTIDDGPSLTTAAGLGLADPITRWQDEYGAAWSTSLMAGDPGGAGPRAEAITITLAVGQISGVTYYSEPPTHIESLSAGNACQGFVDY